MKLTARYAVLLPLLVLSLGFLLPGDRPASAQSACKFKTLSSANCQLITDAGRNLATMHTFVMDYTAAFQASGLSSGNINFSAQGTGPVDLSAVHGDDLLDTLSNAVFASTVTSKLTTGTKTTPGTLDLRMVDGYLYLTGSLIPEKTGVKFDMRQMLLALPATMRNSLTGKTANVDVLGSLQSSGFADVPGVYQIAAHPGRAVDGQPTTLITMNINLDAMLTYAAKPENQNLLQALAQASGQTLSDAQISQIQQIVPLLEPTLKATKVQETFLIGTKDHFYHGYGLTISTRVDPTLAALLGVSLGSASAKPITASASLQLTFSKIGSTVTVKGIDDAQDRTDIVLAELYQMSGGVPSSSAMLPSMTPTTTPTSTPTMPATAQSPGPGAFAASGAVPYTSSDNVLELNLPVAFKPGTDSALGMYIYTYKISDTESVVLEVAVGEPQDIYATDLQLPDSANSPQDALTQLSKITTDPSVAFSSVKPGKVGTFDAQTMGVSVTGSNGNPSTQLEFRIAPLPDGKIVLLVEEATSDLWTQTKPALDAMIDSLKIHSENIPTLTPTATLHPLLITATALESQILALTPSEIPSVTPPMDSSPTPSAIGTLSAGYYEQIPQSTTADGAQILGDPNAPVTLMLFEDYACPHCLEFAPTVKSVIAQFVQTGQARLIVEPQTFVGRAFSDTAAQATYCAAKQNHYWEMRDGLYVLQELQGYQAFTPDALGRWATTLRMNGADLTACILSGETEPIVKSAIQRAASLNITSVPALLWSTDGITFKPFTDADGQRIVPAMDDIAAVIQKNLVGITQPTSYPSDTATPAVVFPAVPPGGTIVTSDFPYFHSSGLLSIPHIVGWDGAGQGDISSEQRFEGASDDYTPGPGTPMPSKNTILGITFINQSAYSVIHAFAERDPERKAQRVTDLDAYYTHDVLDQAWSNFTGGWTELNRRLDNDTFVINFELHLGDQTYLARQLSRFDHDWLLTLRLVTPNNNPQLLDQLQDALWPNYQLYIDHIVGPITWNAANDYIAGYNIRYPADWQVSDGVPGEPYTLFGTINTDRITLITRAETHQAINSEDDARQWVKVAYPNATILTVQTAANFGAMGYAVSYSKPDSDGTQHSDAVTLLNGANTMLYVAILDSSVPGENLLDSTDPAVPPDLATIRASFRILPTNAPVPTQQPSLTPTPSPTLMAAPTEASPEPSTLTSTATGVTY